MSKIGERSAAHCTVVYAEARSYRPIDEPAYDWRVELTRWTSPLPPPCPGVVQEVLWVDDVFVLYGSFGGAWAEDDDMDRCLEALTDGYGRPLRDGAEAIRRAQTLADSYRACRERLIAVWRQEHPEEV